MRAFTEQVRKDIANYKNGGITKLPTNKEYSENFKISQRSVTNYLKNSLTQEEKDYRKKEIQKQEGGKSWESKTEEQKQKYKDMIRKNNENSFLSEEMHKATLESEGWKVERLFKKEEIKGLGWRNIFRYAELQDFLKGTKQEKVAEKLLNTLQELTKNKYKLQDFICKKNKYIKFCEIKNKQTCIPEEVEQMEAIKEIWDNFGIETELVNLHIDLEDIERFCLENKTNNLTIEVDEKGQLFFK